MGYWSWVIVLLIVVAIWYLAPYAYRAYSGQY